MAIGDKHTFVGQFFENVGHHILGGELSRDESGDLCLWRQETSVEVKGSGSQSSYGFRLSVEQIRHYQRIQFFPFSRVWYMFFAYTNKSKRNKQNGSKESQLSKHSDPWSINTYLAKSLEWCLLVDLSIVSKWEEKLPHSRKSVMGHRGMETVDLKPRYVYEFYNGGLETKLTDLELNPKYFGVIHGQIKTQVKIDLFNEHEIAVPLTAIIPSCEVTSLQRRLRRRGYKLNRRNP